MKKSLQDYALAAEIVGAVAVVVSLIYVGVNVNQHTNAIQVANHHALVAMDQATTDWFKDPEFAATYLIASEDIEIHNYQVVVETTVETGDGEELEVIFSVHLPAAVTEMTVPAEFIALADEFKYEVLVRESSFNQTAVESCFMVEGE